MGLINNGNKIMGAAPSTGFQYPFPIDYGCKFERVSTDGLYVARGSTPTVSYKKCAVSFWFKRAGVTGAGLYQGMFTNYLDASNYSWVALYPDDQLEIQYYGGAMLVRHETTAVFRDPTHWNHLHFKIDTTQATQADRFVVHINGIESVGTYTYPTLNADQATFLTHNWTQLLGCYTNTVHHFDGYLADIHAFSDMTTDFDEHGEWLNNTWVPKDYGDGDHGTLGFHLAFADSGNLGDNTASSGIDLSSTLGSPAQTEDTPTNNFPTLDPLIIYPNASGIEEAGLHYDHPVGTTWRTRYLTSPCPKTGKWQVEFQMTANGNTNYQEVGLSNTSSQAATYPNANGIGYRPTGVISLGGVSQGTFTGWTTANVIGLVYDADAETIAFYIDGALETTIDISSLTGEDLFFCIGAYSTSEEIDVFNGAEGFTYHVTGALPICTANWPTPEVIDSEQGLFVNTRTGNGGTQNVTGVPFAPRMSWSKRRDAIGHNQVYDVVRGAEQYLVTNTTGNEYDWDEGVTAFNSDGITILNGVNLELTVSGATYVDWLFNMLPAYGMDIVTYEGTGAAHTEAHNLGATPELIIIKNRDAADNWMVYCAAVAADAETDYLILNSTAAAADLNTPWNDTAPTSSVFTVGTHVAVNTLNESYIAYLFRSVPGFLKVGYYIGNGSADGPRIHTDFRVRYLLTKVSSTTGSWAISDSGRSTYNVIDDSVYADSSAAEITTGVDFDYLANGFKLRSTSFNTNTARYVYLAIGDAFPYVNAF